MSGIIDKRKAKSQDNYSYGGKILSGTSAEIKTPKGAGKILTTDMPQLEDKVKEEILRISLDSANKAASFALEAIFNINNKEDRERFADVFGKHYGENARDVILQEAEEFFARQESEEDNDSEQE